MQHDVTQASRGWLCITMAAVLLGGCAKVNDAGLRLFSTKTTAYLIVNGQLLSGDLLLVPDRSGRASLAAEQGAVRSCSGGMRYSATNSGEVDLRCNEGSQLSLKITLLSDTRGYGYATTSDKGPASLVFGLSMQDALAFLSVPPGMSLAIDPTTDELALKSAGAEAVTKPAAPEAPGRPL